MAEVIARQQIRIQKDNAIFALLTPAEKRVFIARDVLKWLELGKLKALKGHYLEFDAATSAKDLAGDATCEACALGAVFACAAVRVDTINLQDDYGGLPLPYEMRGALGGFFDDNELMNIENAFEGENINQRHAFSDRKAYSAAARTFNAGIRNANKRMERIMKNIIRNKGTFKP
jgi:hypothetical protein